MVAAAAGLGSLAAGIETMGVVGIIAAVALLRWVPRYSAFATIGPRSRDRKIAPGWEDVDARTRTEPERG